jgi:uncharacterized protein YbaP (TraB family)
MWVVKSPTAQIYLFGTLHVLSPRTQWRTPLYDKVYGQAKTVWFETDVSKADPVTVTNLISRFGVDPDRTLSQKLSAEPLAELKTQADIARVDHLRPWAAALMLSVQPALAHGGEIAAGADITVERSAKAEAKQVRSFESLEDQMRIYATLPEPAEVQYLTDVLAEARPHLTLSAPASAQPKGATSIEDAWAAGDQTRLGSALTGEMQASNPALYDALLKRRNLAWADELTTELKSGSGVELVNVGALHMVGDDGLPALLKARGYVVERVQ